MRSLLICCLFIATMFTNGFSTSILPFDFTNGFKHLNTVGTVTAYGNAVATFNPDSSLKRVRCRPPKDTVCLVYQTGATTDNLTTYDNGNLTGTYTVGMYISHVINASGEDVFEW
jgi:hypothetical protein